MKQISLEQLTLTGFKSYVETTTFKPDPQAGLNFMTGINLAEPSLDANGCGKSALWDGLVWCLYGSTPRGGRASAITSWGKERPNVEVSLLIDGLPCTIDREGSPDRLYLDGEPCTQEQLVKELGLTRSAFLQSVVFGQDVPLFYDLSIPKRGVLLDEVLNLSLWLRASKSASEAVRSYAAELNKLAEQVAYLNGKIAVLENDKVVREAEANWADTHKQAMQSALQRIAQIEDAIKSAASAFTAAKRRLAALKPTTTDDRLDAEKAEWMAQLYQAQADLKKAEDAFDFYKHNLVCPTCHQKITPSFADDKMAEARKELKGCDQSIKQFEAQVRALQTEIDKERQFALLASRETEEARRAVNATDLQLRYQEQSLENYVRQAEEVADQTVNPFTAQLEKMATELRDAEAQLASLESTREDLTTAQSHAIYWRDGFKQVRLFLVARILRHLEVETANAAAALGLHGWKIEFATETENKSGTMEQGIQIEILMPEETLQSREWSPGELQRVRLAVAFGLAALIQAARGVRWDFEIFDEPSNWLSGGGIEALVSYLGERAEQTRKAIWLLDHRALPHGDFRAVWSAEKSTEGTTLRRLT